ncbi:hypothetical protein PDIDSM_9144 [Penicillium digitatum]|nr:hypothetical protein PDIDSM_9144 [Penicillium digitatum]
MGDPFAVGKSQLHTRVSGSSQRSSTAPPSTRTDRGPFRKKARNRKTRLIKIALRRYHRRKVQEVIEGPGGDQHDPTEINRGPIRFPEITHQEIKQAVKASPPDKAPGEDGLPNSLWHKLIEIPTVLDTISRIYNACIRLGTNPTHFQKSITVVLRKAGKRDYQLAKSYRPVALLNTLGKFLEAVVARRISYAVETYKLLPDTHFGGRKGISVDHAIQSIIGRYEELGERQDSKHATT